MAIVRQSGCRDASAQKAPKSVRLRFSIPASLYARLYHDAQSIDVPLAHYIKYTLQLASPRVHYRIRELLLADKIRHRTPRRFIALKRMKTKT
jgi:hypothetical protein